jgi:hypothetical protein
MARTRRDTRRSGGILRFAIVLSVAFIVLAAVWGSVVPTYNRLVALVAAPVFRAVESDNVTALEARGDQLWVGRRAANGVIEPFSYFDAYVYFGLVPLLALLLATPWGRWARRVWRTLAGLGLLFGMHVIYVVGSVELSYAAVGLGGAASTGPLLDWAQILLRIVWQVSPVLIALALAAGVWRSRVRAWRESSLEVQHGLAKGSASRSARC